MLIGAQLFSIRKRAQTPEEIYEAFKIISGLGYKVVQVSALGPIKAERLHEISKEFSLPITCTHTPLDRLQNDLDAVIEEHRILGCHTIGLGAMPKSLRDGKFETFKAFFDGLYPITEKIIASGFDFAYHNHDFEFKELDNGEKMYDYIIENAPDWSLICDICWMQYAKVDVVDYIRKIKGRIRNVHLKDIKAYEGTDFCPLGEGIVELEKIIPVLKECGAIYAHVEQDNACDVGDPFEQLDRSMKYLKSKNFA